jgi:hypothetical protein
MIGWIFSDWGKGVALGTGADNPPRGKLDPAVEPRLLINFIKPQILSIRATEAAPDAR